MINRETATMTFECPKCKNEFRAHIVEHKGGINDYGWWVIKCDACKTVFDTYIGRDVNDSSLSSGGVILERFDKEISSEKDVKEAVEKYKEQ